MDSTQARKRVVVIIPVHNRWAYTRECLKSLYQQTFLNCSIVVIDDGSTDGTRDYISKEFPKVIIIKGDGNLWWSGATNLGVQWALNNCNEEDFVLTLNNDTICPPSYLEELCQVAAEHRSSIIGSTTLDNRDQSIVVDSGLRINFFTAKYKNVAAGVRYKDLRKYSSQTREVDALPGRGTLIPISAFKRAGIFNASQLPQYGADYEFSIRARRKGFTLLVSNRAYLLSRLEATGLNNDYNHLRWGQFFSAFFSIRSPYNIRYRWNFARLVCPRLLLPSYFLLDTARLIGGSLFNQLLMRKLNSTNPRQRAESVTGNNRTISSSSTIDEAREH